MEVRRQEQVLTLELPDVKAAIHTTPQRCNAIVNYDQTTKSEGVVLGERFKLPRGVESRQGFAGAATTTPLFSPTHEVSESLWRYFIRAS